MIKFSHSLPLFKSLQAVKIIPSRGYDKDHIFHSNNATLIFSTLILDDINQSPIILSKTDLAQHLPSVISYNPASPCFHLVSIVYRDSGEQYLTIADLGTELQLSKEPSLNSKFELNRQSTGIFVLYSKNLISDYNPCLTNNIIINLHEIPRRIKKNKAFRTDPVDIFLCSLQKNDLVATPVERGNFFFSGAQEKETVEQFENLYDLQPVMLPILSPHIYYSHGSLLMPYNGTYSSSFHPKNQKVFAVNPQIYECISYDDILAQILSKHFKFCVLEDLADKIMTFPFTFPFNQDLDNTLIFPDKMILPQGDGNHRIYRKHRSPLFFILAQLNVDKPNCKMSITPLGLIIFVKGKFYLVDFTEQISTDILSASDNTGFKLGNKQQTAYSPLPFEWKTKENKFVALPNQPLKLHSLGIDHSPILLFLNEYLPMQTYHNSLPKYTQMPPENNLQTKFALKATDERPKVDNTPITNPIVASIKKMTIDIADIKRPNQMSSTSLNPNAANFHPKMGRTPIPIESYCPSPDNYTPSANTSHLSPTPELMELSKDLNKLNFAPIPPWPQYPIGLSNSTPHNEDRHKHLNTLFTHINISSLEFDQKSLFVFENEMQEPPIKTRHVPKLLATLLISHPMKYYFEKICGLIDTGSDVTLLTLKKLKALMPQHEINEHLRKENAVLTSFSNNDISIIGKIKLPIKLHRQDAVRHYEFIIINQNSIVDLVIGQDMLVQFQLSILNSPKGPSIQLGNGSTIDTYHERMENIATVSALIHLKGKESKIIKVSPHAAYSAFQNERILIEGSGKHGHMVIPLACKMIRGNKIPIAVINHKKEPVTVTIEATLSTLNEDNKILHKENIFERQTYSVLSPVDITNDESPLLINNIEKTQEINIYRVQLSYTPQDIKQKTKYNEQNDMNHLHDQTKIGNGPENFLKELNTKLLPDGYEIQNKADISDIIKLSDYPESYRHKVKDIFIDKYSKIVSKHDYEIGDLSKTMGPIKITLKPNANLPAFKRVYYLHDIEGQHLKDILSYLEREGIITKSHPNLNSGFTNFSSPAYLVAKANPHKSAYRLIINYKNLNSEILTTVPVLPNISQYLQRLSKAYLFSQFDLSSAFYSLSLDQDSQKYTLFTTCVGNYHFLKLPMGLNISPQVFCDIARRLIHSKPVLDENGKPIYTPNKLCDFVDDPIPEVLLFFDDLLIFTEFQTDYQTTLNEHFRIMEKVMQRLFYHDSRIKWSKTEICKTEVLFLGHKIRQGVLYADPRRVEKLLKSTFPTTLTQVKSYLGVLNSIRSFLPQNIMKHMMVLQDLTSTTKGFKPQKIHHEAFENLKICLTETPLYSNIINPNSDFLLFCDAATGERASFSAVLTQILPNNTKYLPPYFNLCDPIHHHIYQNNLKYRPLPRYFGDTFVCKSKVEKSIYTPTFSPSYYEKPLLMYTAEQVKRSFFITVNSIYYDQNCQAINELEIRKEAVQKAKKNIVFHKLKTFNFGGHHINTMKFLDDFQNNYGQVDSFLHMLLPLAETLRRTIILLEMNEKEQVNTHVYNSNDKAPLIIALYRTQHNLIFYPFKNTTYQSMNVEEFKDKIQIVSYYSKTIPQTTSQLDICQLEALGILYALEAYKSYIKMSNLTIVTDNLVFFSIFSKKILDHNTVMSRYALKILTSFPHVKIRHILTKYNLADFLTRERKIDRATFQRLPLSSFQADPKIRDIIDQSQSFTLLQFKDFCDDNQANIIITQHTNKHKANTTKHNNIALISCSNINKAHPQQLSGVTTEPIDIDGLYKSKNVILMSSDFEKSEIFNHNPFYSIQSKIPLTSINAITRGDTKRHTYPQTPKPTQQTETEPKGPPQYKHNINTRQNAKRKYKPSSINEPQIPSTNSSNTSPSKLHTPKNTPNLVNQTSIPTEPLPNTSKQSESQKDQKHTDSTNDSHQNDHNKTDIPKNTDTNNDTPSPTQSDTPEISPDLDNHLQPVRKHLDNHNKDTDPFKLHWDLGRLLHFITSYQQLIKYQKEDLPDIYNKCLMSTNFQHITKEGTYHLQNLVLYITTDKEHSKIVAPPSKVGTMIALFHLLQKHAGAKRLVNCMSHYYIPSLLPLLRLYISTCYTCLLVNKSKQTKIGHTPAIRCAYTIHMDLIEDLNQNLGYRHVLVVIDSFSKFLLAWPIKSKTTRQILPFIVFSLYQTFNVRTIVTDNGSLFSSQQYVNTLKTLQINNVKVPPHSPRSNGQSEIFVQHIKTNLRKSLAHNKTENWLSELPLLVKIHNTSKLAGFNLSPLEIIHGELDPNSVTELTNPSLNLEVPPHKSATETSEKMKAKLATMKKVMEENNIKAKNRRNKNLPLPTITINDYVIAKDFRIIPMLNKTLHPKFINEIFIVEKVKKRSVIARSLANYTLKIISFNNLKVVNEKNFKKLNIPEEIMKLLLRDTYSLTQKEKFLIAKETATVLLPEPDPDLLDDDISDTDDLPFEEDNEITDKTVTFDIDNEDE